MTVRIIKSVEEAKALLGVSLGTSDPVTIVQARVDAFAEATGDHQWIHVDPVRAAAGPFGVTIAHGYLTVSLLPALCAQIYTVDFGAARLNYGSNKVRFPTPVTVGSTVRATATIIDVQHSERGTQLTTEVSITADCATKPACVAQTITLVLGGDS